MFQWVIPQWLFVRKAGHQLCRCISDCLPKIEFVFGDSQFCVIHERPIFIGIGPRFSFLELVFIHWLCSPVWPWRVLNSLGWLASRLFCPSQACSYIHISLGVSRSCLVISSPMLSSCLQECPFCQLNRIRLINILSMLRCYVWSFLELLCIIGFDSSCEIKSFMIPFYNVLNVVVLRNCVLKVWHFVITLSVIEVVQSILEISLSLSVFPHLISILKFLALFFCRVG